MVSVSLLHEFDVGDLELFWVSVARIRAGVRVVLHHFLHPFVSNAFLLFLFSLLLHLFDEISVSLLDQG